MSLIPMIARVHLEYGGKAYAPGHYFEAIPVQASILNRLQKARLLGRGEVMETRDMEPEPEVNAEIEPDPEPEPESDVEPEPEPPPTPVKRKRTYKRRDMKAQR